MISPSCGVEGGESDKLERAPARPAAHSRSAGWPRRTFAAIVLIVALTNSAPRAARARLHHQRPTWTSSLSSSSSSSSSTGGLFDELPGALPAPNCGTRYPSYDDPLAASTNLLYIVGGDEVEDGQFWPWSVAIYELDPLNGQRAFICSGSLISERYILTAAHCIKQSRFDVLAPDEVFLKIASVRLDDHRNEFYQVERIYIHPDYTVERKKNDIALLKLRAGQRLPARARPICLPSQVANRIDFTDQQVTIIGWGKTSAMQGNEPTRLIDIVTGSRQSPTRTTTTTAGGPSGGPLGAPTAGGQQRSQAAAYPASVESQTNDTLLQAEVRVTSTDQCNRNYSRLEIDWLNIDEHFICASDPQGKRDACQGDSGGPLMWNDQQAAMTMGGQQPDEAHQAGPERWYQLGLVSFGYGCANKQYPGVYTSITYYMPWIMRIVAANAATWSGR